MAGDDQQGKGMVRVYLSGYAPIMSAAIAMPLLNLSVVWFLLAIFTLCMAAGALYRTVPKREG
jgi:hypothetical protein